jgi:hypothetical protein
MWLVLALALLASFPLAPKPSVENRERRSESAGAAAARET